MVIYFEKYLGYMYIDLGKNGWEKIICGFLFEENF